MRNASVPTDKTLEANRMSFVCVSVCLCATLSSRPLEGHLSHLILTN